MTDLNKYLIFNFVTGERTKDLSNYCFHQLGFENIVNIENNESFHKKYLKFAELAVESNFDYFIRSDADRLVFDGLIDLIQYYESNKELSNITGKFFDYFMNNFRGGTPSFFKRDTLEELVLNPSCIGDNQKPETQFGRYLESMPDKFTCKNVNIFTNLHEYEQFPSKVCNVFINRFSRNHQHLYDNRYLNTLPDEYKIAISTASQYFNKNGSKKTMSFLDFKDLDSNYPHIHEDDIPKLYKKYRDLYFKIKEKHK